MTDYKTTQRAVEIATAIAALPDDAPESAVVELFGPGDYDAFYYMDEKPGDIPFSDLDRVWHSRLRRARNNPDNDLFERMG